MKTPHAVVSAVGTNGGMGEECKMFMKHFAEKLAEKDVEGYPIVISWLRTRISFEILRASLCKILISSFAHKMDFVNNFSVDFF